MEASLYVHVPFCADLSAGFHEKCAYCDFYSVLLEKDSCLPERYIETLLSDAERLLAFYRPAKIPTLYIGGGTPSVLGARGIGRLLRGLLELGGAYAPAPEEITLEANPESADEAFLSAARGSGATRLSLGVQSFHGPSRRAVKRIGAGPGSAESLLHERLKLAAAYFPGAFSADLITGLPFQDEEILLRDIAALLDYRPAHVSLYALTVESGTPLAGYGKAVPLPGEDEAGGLWIAGRDALERAGYGQYEVSNFCLPRRESRHNVRYWRMENWLALGPAASATLIDEQNGRGFRYTVPPDLEAWLKSGGVFSRESGVPASIIEELDTPTLIKESFLMGFRCIEGPDEAMFRGRFGRSVEELIPKTLGAWRKRGLAPDGKAALSKEGLLFLDPFLVDTFKELDAGLSPGRRKRKLDASFLPW